MLRRDGLGCGYLYLAFPSLQAFLRHQNHLASVVSFSVLILVSVISPNLHVYHGVRVRVRVLGLRLGLRLGLGLGLGLG